MHEIRPPEANEDYAPSIAGDIYRMIQAAAAQGLDMSAGFQTDALSSARMRISYLFYPKRQLANIGLPRELQSKVKASNVLGMIAFQDRPPAVFLLCVMARPFQSVESEDDVRAGIVSKGVADFSKALREALRQDFEIATDEEMAMAEQQAPEPPGHA